MRRVEFEEALELIGMDFYVNTTKFEEEKTIRAQSCDPSQTPRECQQKLYVANVGGHEEKKCL